MHFKIINSETTLYGAATISVLYIYGVTSTHSTVLYLELKQILRYKIHNITYRNPQHDTSRTSTAQVQ